MHVLCFFMPVCTLVVDIRLCCKAEHLAHSVIIQCCGREHYNIQSPLAHRSNCIISSTRVIAHTSWCSAQWVSLPPTLFICLCLSLTYTHLVIHTQTLDPSLKSDFQLKFRISDRAWTQSSSSWRKMRVNTLQHIVCFHRIQMCKLRFLVFCWHCSVPTELPNLM